MPTKRPGAFRPLASAVTEIEEVLEARTQRHVDLGLELAEQRPLGVGVLDDRLDHQAGAGGVVEPVDGADAGDGRLRLLGVELALGDQAFERLLELGAGRGGGAFAGIEQRTVCPACAATWAMPAPMMPAPTTSTGVPAPRSMFMRPV